MKINPDLLPVYSSISVSNLNTNTAYPPIANEMHHPNLPWFHVWQNWWRTNWTSSVPHGKCAIYKSPTHRLQDNSPFTSQVCPFQNSLWARDIWLDINSCFFCTCMTTSGAHCFVLTLLPKPALFPAVQASCPSSSSPVVRKAWSFTWTS